MVDYLSLFVPGILLALGTFILVFFLAIYVYYALALMTIGKKLKHKNPWLAWIPFANISMLLQLGGFHWAWVFLILIPILGWIALAILVIIATWKVYEKRGYPGGLALISLASGIPWIGVLASIANLIVLGFVAWVDKPKKR